MSEQHQTRIYNVYLNPHPSYTVCRDKLKHVSPLLRLLTPITEEGRKCVLAEKKKMQLITDIEQEQEIVDCWVDLITYMKSVPFAPPLSKSNLYSAPLEEQEKIDHKSTKLPKLHLLSFHSSVFFFSPSSRSLPPGLLRSLSLPLSISLCLLSIPAL